MNVEEINKLVEEYKSSLYGQMFPEEITERCSGYRYGLESQSQQIESLTKELKAKDKEIEEIIIIKNLHLENVWELKSSNLELLNDLETLKNRLL